MKGGTLLLMGESKMNFRKHLEKSQEFWHIKNKLGTKQFTRETVVNLI